MKDLACSPDKIQLLRVPFVWWAADRVFLDWGCHLTRHWICVTKPGTMLRERIEAHTAEFNIPVTDKVLLALFKSWMGWNYDDLMDDEEEPGTPTNIRTYRQADPFDEDDGGYLEKE